MGQSQEIMPTEHFGHQASDTASRDEESGSDEGVYEVERIVGHCVQGVWLLESIRNYWLIPCT